MPATVTFRDPAVSITPPTGHAQAYPLLLGPGRQPNDVRFLMVSASGSHDAGATSSMMPMQDDPPPGFSTAYAMAPGDLTEGCYYYRIPADLGAESSVAWPKPKGGWRHFCWATFTGRGLDPAHTPVGGHLTVTHEAGSGTAIVASVTAPGAGVLVYMLGTVPDPGSGGLWPAWSGAMGVPVSGGWKHIVATENSGEDFFEFDSSNNIMVIGRPVGGAGAVGTVTVPISKCGAAFAGLWLFVQAAPDGSSSGGAITAIDSVGTPSSSSATNPHSIAAPIVVTDSVGTPSNPLHGYLIDDPTELDGNPVAGSITRWSATVPAGATLTVETSLNNGASWDVATNGKPIPRLRNGDTSVRRVLNRVTFTRTSAAGPMPVLHSIEVWAHTTRSEDELLPTFYGAVDKAKTKVTAGSSGGSGSGGGGAGVVSRGGGMHGGGAVMRIHATDPSRLIKLAKWQSPIVFGAGLTYDELLRAMVLDRRPNQKLFNQVSLGRTLEDSPITYGLNGGGDPLQDIKDVAISAGGEAFYDTIGAFCSRPVPDPRRGTPVWVFDRAIIESEDEIDDHLVVNGYVIKGESTASANPVSAFAFNTDPASRFNIFPPPVGIGMRIETLTFPLAETEEQCQAIADALLLDSMGLAQTVTLRVPPHPGLLAGDIVRVDSPATGVVGNFMVQGYQLPDSPTSDMTITCFRQTDNP